MPNCSDCGKPLTDGNRCVVWSDDPEHGLCFRFICIECSNNQEYKTAEEIESEHD